MYDLKEMRRDSQRLMAALAHKRRQKKLWYRVMIVAGALILFPFRNKGKKLINVIAAVGIIGMSAVYA